MDPFKDSPSPECKFHIHTQKIDTLLNNSSLQRHLLREFSHTHTRSRKNLFRGTETDIERSKFRIHFRIDTICFTFTNTGANSLHHNDKCFPKRVCGLWPYNRFVFKSHRAMWTGTKCLDEESYIQDWEFKCSRICHCKSHFVPSLNVNFRCKTFS